MVKQSLSQLKGSLEFTTSSQQMTALDEYSVKRVTRAVLYMLACALYGQLDFGVAGSLAVMTLMLPLLASPEGRLITVFGVLLLGGGTSDLSPDKFLAVGQLLLAAISSALSGRRKLESELKRLTLGRSAWLLLAVYVSTFGLLASVNSGTDFIDYARDSVQYLIPLLVVTVLTRDLLRVHPWIAQSVALAALIILSGLWSLHWAATRGFVDLQVPAAGTDSIPLLLAGIYFLEVRRTRSGSIMTAIALLLAFASGSRSLVALQLLILLLFGTKLSPRRAIQVATGIATVFVASWIIAPIVTSGIGVNLEAVGQRLTSVVQLSDTGLSSDASFQIRKMSTQAALHTFQASPIFGVGPGYRYAFSGVLPQSGAFRVVGYQLDSPAAALAELGLIGYGLFLSCLISAARGLASVGKDVYATKAATAWLASAIFVTIVQNCVLDNKYFSVGMAAFCTLVITQSRTDKLRKPAQNSSERVVGP